MYNSMDHSSKHKIFYATNRIDIKPSDTSNRFVFLDWERGMFSFSTTFDLHPSFDISQLSVYKNNPSDMT